MLQYLFSRLIHRIFPTAQPFGYQPIDLSLSDEISDEKQSDVLRNPQTLSYALCDSPVGLLAHVRQYLHTSSTHQPWTPSDILNWTMLHWLPGPEAGLRFHGQSIPDMRDVRELWSPIPLGISVFADSWCGPPPSWAACMQRLIWQRRHKGRGKFAAWERPDELVEDLREFFGEIILPRTPRLKVTDLEEID